MYKTSEHIIAKHAAAVLADKKPSSLFTVKKYFLTDIFYILEETALKAIVMRNMDDRVLLFVYNPSLLAQTLHCKIVKNALQNFGYPPNQTTAEALNKLKERFSSTEAFPHEIGFFLGYPPLDVAGFIEHGGKNCKYCGMWKVYDCPEHAKFLCEQYNQCKQLCCRHVEAGGNLKTFKLPA